jgi:hypothetical protein
MQFKVTDFNITANYDIKNADMVNIDIKLGEVSYDISKEEYISLLTENKEMVKEVVVPLIKKFVLNTQTVEE